MQRRANNNRQKVDLCPLLETIMPFLLLIFSVNGRLLELAHMKALASFKVLDAQHVGALDLHRVARVVAHRSRPFFGAPVVDLNIPH